MLVYRVEHLTHRIGPYVSDNHVNNVIRRMKDEHNKDDKNHPGVIKDCNFEWDYGDFVCDFHCGFHCIEDLIDWFDDYIFELQSLGYRITVYETPVREIRFGLYQLAFIRNRSKRIKTMVI